MKQLPFFCKLKVEKLQPSFVQVLLHKFNNYDSPPFLGTLKNKTGKVQLNFIAKTTESSISLKYRCLKLMDFLTLSSTLDHLSKLLEQKDFQMIGEKFSTRKI